MFTTLTHWNTFEHLKIDSKMLKCSSSVGQNIKQMLILSVYLSTVPYRWVNARPIASQPNGATSVLHKAIDVSDDDRRQHQPQIDIAQASIRHFRVGSMSDRYRSEGLCYLEYDIGNINTSGPFY